MREFIVNGKPYFDVKAIREVRKDVCRGIRSNSEFVAKKGIKDFVYGKVVDNELVVTAKYSRKFGSVFVNEDAVSELFSEKTATAAPPLIEDADFVFFRDDDGREYRVPMRGERSKDGIYFEVKGVMTTFNMPSLNDPG